MPSKRLLALFVGLYLLASVALVSAERSWVLWFTSGRGGNMLTSPSDAYPTREECLKEAARGTKTEVADFKKYPDEIAYMTCLPDTVDPRGAKGGGR